MRFRRRAKIFPGVYLNFSKNGISTTIGPRGASINFSSKGTYLNTGIPGTGLYDRQKIGGGKSERQHHAHNEVPVQNYTSEEVGEIKSEDIKTITTEGLQELKKTLLDCYQERNDLKKEEFKASIKFMFAIFLWLLSCIAIVGFFIKWFKEYKQQKEDYLNDIKNQLANCFVDIDMDVDEQINKKYLSLLDGYKILVTCEKIWDITASVAVNQFKERSNATANVTRKRVTFGFGNIDIIKSKYDALHFENANGGNLYIYPAFIAMVDSQKQFGLIDIRELSFKFNQQLFIESEHVPSDSVIVDHTWAKVNKNGSPDRRFKENYQIPICRYADIGLSSKTGLNEEYQFSSYEKSEKFGRAMKEYQESMRAT